MWALHASCVFIGRLQLQRLSCSKAQAGTLGCPQTCFSWPGLLILNMALPTSQDICFQCAISWKYVLIELLKILNFFMSLINVCWCFSPSLTSVISPVREIWVSNRCPKYFDRVFVSVSGIKPMWWQADSKKRFAPNVLQPHFSSSLFHLKISFTVITLARALLKKESFPDWVKGILVFLLSEQASFSKTLCVVRKKYKCL